MTAVEITNKRWCISAKSILLNGGQRCRGLPGIIFGTVKREGRAENSARYPSNSLKARRYDAINVVRVRRYDAINAARVWRCVSRRDGNDGKAEGWPDECRLNIE